MNGAVEALRTFFSRFSVLKRPDPVNDVASYTEFLASRPAFVGQKKLFEYVKTRMGISYPEHFKNDQFIASLNIAKWHVYAACMQDLGIWMAGRMSANGATADEARALSAYAFRRSAHERFSEPGFPGDIAEIVKEFEDRLALTDLIATAQGDKPFHRSARKLVEWAPIAPQLKKYDEEIVQNSIRFAWVTFREEFNRITDFAAVLADWREYHEDD
jgi:hypothetical protein